MRHSEGDSLNMRKKIIMRFLLFFVLFNLSAVSLTNIAFSAEDRTRRSVWKLQVPYEGDISYGVQGTGFFVGSHHFITSLQIFLPEEDSDLKLDYDFNNKDFILLQEGESVRQLRVKKILAISALDNLALLETEEPSDYLRVRGSSHDEEYPDSNLIVLGYGAELSLKERKQAGNIFREGDSYFFTLDNPISYGFSGSPVLNEKGTLMGILDQSDSSIGNLGHAITVNPVIKFLAGKTGLDCNPFPYFQDCIKQEIKNLHEQAEKSHVPSQYRLGKMYEQGEGVEQDFQKAMYWYREATEQRHTFAKFKMGLLYEQRGEEEQAEHWYIQATEKGLPLAQNNLAGIYLNKRNIKKAIHWLKQAAEQEFSAAQANLAQLYENTKGEEQDFQKAMYWYAKAAKKGYSPASYSLGVMDYKQRNFEEALKHFATAAEQGDVLAQYSLAVIYTTGEGTKKDMKKAEYWYSTAAKQGHIFAQHNLAVMYEQGIGVEQNFEEAVYWYAQATEQGHAPSLDNLLDMYRQDKGTEHIEKVLSSWNRRRLE